jgi:hypothetical protein
MRSLSWNLGFLCVLGGLSATRKQSCRPTIRLGVIVPQNGVMGNFDLEVADNATLQALRVSEAGLVHGNVFRGTNPCLKNFYPRGMISQ